jgi:hypothetical protein
MKMMLLESKAVRAFTLNLSHSMFRYPVQHGVVEVEYDLQAHFTDRCQRQRDVIGLITKSIQDLRVSAGEDPVSLFSEHAKHHLECLQRTLEEVEGQLTWSERHLVMQSEQSVIAN